MKASARRLFCYWAVRDLGYGLTELARHFGITQPAVGYEVKRGKHIANQNHYKLEK